MISRAILEWDEAAQAYSLTCPELNSSMNIYFNKSVPVPFFKLYAKKLTLKSGLANPMADILSMLDFIAQRQVKVGAVRTVVVDWADASTVLLEDTTKVMVRRNPMFG